MSEWKEYEVKTLIKKGLLSIGDGYRAKNSELSDEGIPFARAGNLNGGFDFSNCDYFPKEDLKKVGEKRSQVGDVVFTSKGTVGRFAFVDDKTPEFVFSPQLCYWRSLNGSIIEPSFLYYWMQSRAFTAQISAVKGQTDMADYVSLRDQYQMVVTLPEIKTQKELAVIFSALDQKIALLHHQNQTLENIAQTLFQHWFIDFEFPNEDGKPYRSAGGKMVESDLGEIPDGWGISPLDEIGDYLNGLALQKYPPESEENFLPVIKIKELKSGISDGTDKASVNIPKKYIIDNGDVIFSWSGSLEVVIWHQGKGALNQHLFKVTSNKYPKWFYYFWTLKYLPKFRHIAQGKATTMGHIQRHHLSEALCFVPEKELLKNAEPLFASFLNKIINNYSEIQTLTKTRDTLLPKLMSGQVRIK